MRIYITLTMEQNPVPFGDDVGLEVLAALKELGEGLSKLSEIESMSKTGQREFCVMWRPSFVVFIISFNILIYSNQFIEAI